MAVFLQRSGAAELILTTTLIRPNLFMPASAVLARIRSLLPRAGRERAGDVSHTLVDFIAAITGEPRARATQLLQRSDAGNAAFQADFDALAGCNPRQLERRLATVALGQQAELCTALADLGQPLLLACVHAGPYLGGLLRLVPQLPGARRVTLIRRPQACPRESAVLVHLQRLGVEARVLRLTERPLLPALQALRDRQVLLTMVDVPPSFWPNQSARQGLRRTQLYAQSAWLPEGPAALAVAASAVVLPLFCSGTVRASKVHLGALVNATRRNSESRTEAVTRVHEALARQLGRWLRAMPEDWLLWRHLPSYFVEPAASEDADAARRLHRSAG